MILCTDGKPEDCATILVLRRAEDVTGKSMPRHSLDSEIACLGDGGSLQGFYDESICPPR
jgi:hypothetical protein